MVLSMFKLSLVSMLLCRTLLGRIGAPTTMLLFDFLAAASTANESHAASDELECYRLAVADLD